MEGFNVQESIKAQRMYCEDNKEPHFAPKDGRCWKCGKNIYEPNEKGFGIKTEEASKKLVTGCPHCFRSYCD